jgi:hypothetical protein
MEGPQLECVACYGRGCEQCNQTGKFRLTQCPQKYMTRDITELYRFAEFAIEGHWPVSGGTLEQTPAFLEAMRRVKSDKAAFSRLPHG